MTFPHLSRQSVRYKSEFCIGKLLLGLRMVSTIQNIEVSVNQGLICTHLYGYTFGTSHFCPHFRESGIRGSTVATIAYVD